MDLKIKKKINDLLKKRDEVNVCISLDWLSLYFTHGGLFKEEYQEGDTVDITNDCYLLEINRPTLHFNTHFVLFYKKEECAHVLLNTKNEKFFAKDVIKVEFSNHTLYSQQWVEILQCLTKFGLKYNAASRIDIAIDGVNYLHQLLNIYSKQDVKGKTMLLKNSSKSRARFSAKVLNPANMLYENFNIGASGGNKMITVYNKSLELVKSGKKYIQDYWIKNGLISEPLELETLSQQLDFNERKGYDTFGLKGLQNIYRFELRLKSESIKEIKDFSVEMLYTGEGLASIVRTHCEKYFDACYNDNDNVSYCSSFDLLPYKKLNARIIQKIQRVEKDGLYKAKMGIHGKVADCYKGKLNDENSKEDVASIMDWVREYRLAEWMALKIPEWHNRYLKFLDEKRRYHVTIFIEKIQLLNDEIYKETNALANRHNQARPTAGFGE